MRNKPECLLEIGRRHTLTVLRITQSGVYLDDGGSGILLPGKYCLPEHMPGAEVDVFVYTDSEDRPVATTETPLGMLGDFAAMKVTDTVPYGAFLAWGLDKDLLLPRKYMHNKAEKGDICVVKILLDDETGRLIAASKLKNFFNKSTSALSKGMEVEILFYDKTPLGWAAVVNNEYTGLLFNSDVYSAIVIGHKCTGYVKEITDEGKVTLTLSKNKPDDIQKACDAILHALQENGGVLQISDKSSPLEIQNAFGISKRVFKEASGCLYRQRKIVLNKSELTLV